MVTLTYRIGDGQTKAYTSDLEDPGEAQMDLIMDTIRQVSDSPWVMDVWIGQDADTTKAPNFRHQHQNAD